MELSIEWNSICRVCLQEGILRSVFEYDWKDMKFSEKIMYCCSTNIDEDGILPVQICVKCITDLDIAYRFRSTCENSEKVLQSFLETISGDGEPKPGQNTNTLAPVTDNNVIESVKIEHLDPDNVSSDLENSSVQPDKSYTEINNETSTDNLTEILEDPNDGTVEYYHIDKDVDIVEDALSNSEKYIIKWIHDIDPTDVEKSDQPEITTIYVEDNQTEPFHDLDRNDEMLDAGNVTNSISHQEDTSLLSKLAKRKKPKEKSFECEICGNTFRYKHGWEGHVRRHLNEKPFECKICGRAFVINFELNRHMRIHTGVKPYPCRHCDKKFSDFGSRVKHERAHTGERPYSCTICGKTFGYSHVLTSHYSIHTGEKKYGCDKCGKRFAKSHHLKAHMNVHAKKLERELLMEVAGEPSESKYYYLKDYIDLDNEENHKKCKQMKGDDVAGSIST